MTEVHDNNDRTLDVLHELFASATHDASAAMCRWTDGLITVKLDEVRQIALEEVSAELDIGDELLTMVVLLPTWTIGGGVSAWPILMEH